MLGYRWSDFVSKEWLLIETQMRFVACIVLERQLRLYGHVARFPDADSVHQILSAREPHEWRRLMGQPRASWLQQIDRHLNEMGMGQASALGDGQTEAPGVPAESGRSNALLRRMLPFLT